MKATIEMPIEPNIVLKMSQSEAIVLYELCNWVSSDCLSECALGEMSHKGITAELLDKVIEDTFNTLKVVRQ